MTRTSSLAVLPCVLLLILMSGSGCWGLITNEEDARDWLEQYNTMAEKVYTEYVTGYWDYNTNLTTYNQEVALNGSVMRAQFRKDAYVNTTLFDWQNFQNETLKRQFKKVSDIGTSVLVQQDLEEYEKLNADMELTYSTAEVCKMEPPCHPLDPDLTNIMANSRDWDELEWAWWGWREVSGKKMKTNYTRFVEIQNKAAVANNFEDTGDYWRASYEDKDFEAKCLALWNQVKPLYQNLHAYVKRKLKAQYSDREFPSGGQIPAHLLGNMWAQQWSNLREMVIPYPDYPDIDVTKSLEDQGYDAMRIFNVSEDFFVSLGLEPMPDAFWEKSMIVKPEDRKVVCHASAWDFYNGIDFRIKQCTDITTDWLVTTHHEMGHVEYFLLYKDLFVEYRDGANPGFHEAVGDVLSLSVSTPEHLKSIKLLDEISQDEAYDLNFLMVQALDKIAFLPFGYLIDQWRWSVFRGETTEAQYNKKWWDLRCTHQGISPPSPRDADAFDPGAKFHIPSNTPYIRYFVSFIIQFQFHNSLCEAASITGPKHRCDIYNSKEAGKLLGDMLKLGSSKPWPEAMMAITQQSEMDASALLEYFKPLTDWLEKQNEGHDITWTDNCEPGDVSRAAKGYDVTVASLLITIMVLIFNV